MKLVKEQILNYTNIRALDKSRRLSEDIKNVQNTIKRRSQERNSLNLYKNLMCTQNSHNVNPICKYTFILYLDSWLYSIS